MKITCQACQAKYTIADDKVVGKVVKIRCKKCGATIVVNGNESSGSSSEPPVAGEEAAEGALGASREPWTVNVAEGDQRTMTDAELVSAYRAGVVTDDTFCWRDGMADWLPVNEIPSLLAACKAPGAVAGEFPAKSDVPPPPGASVPPAPPLASKPPAGKDRNGAAVAATTATAARRAGGRGAAADLFSGAAKAGGEDEVLTSAPPSIPQGDHRGAAARDHGAGASKDGGVAAAPSMTATTEASGLIDIRQLGQQMRPAGDDKKKARVDDIMNLGGGGAFSPSLAAPVLTAPSLEHYSQPPPSMLGGPVPATVKNRALIIVASCAGIFFLVAAVGVFVLIFRGPSAAEERDRTPVSTTTATGSAAPTASAGANTPSATATAEAPAASAAHAGETAAAAPSASASAAPAASAASETAAAHPAAVAAAAAPRPVVAAAAPAPAPAGGATFNMGETKARLAAIAGGVQSCKRGETTGDGRVEIVFAPSGAAQSATLLGGSPFDGTPTGKCVEARFRQAHVPAFSGEPTTVRKSFNIN